MDNIENTDNIDNIPIMREYVVEAAHLMVAWKQREESLGHKFPLQGNNQTSFHLLRSHHLLVAR
jgi:hypothetical protein